VSLIKLTITRKRFTMKVTDEMRKAIRRVRSENDFPEDFKWWERGSEVYMRLDEKTVYAVHISGLVTVYKEGV